MVRPVLVALAVGLAAAWPSARQAPTSPLFELTSVLDVHLVFAADQYTALMPTTQGHRVIRETGAAGYNWLQGPEGGRNGLSAANGITFEYVHADVSIGDRTFSDSGVRYKGNGTFMQGRGQGKISFKIDLNHFVKGQKFDGVKTINLHSNITDASYMNEPLAFQLYRDASVPAPRTSYARVFVTEPGSTPRRYVGLFSMVENPDDVFLGARGLKTDGAIFKPVTSSLFAYRGDDWTAYNQTYDPKTDLTDAGKQRVIEAARLVTSATDADFVRGVGSFIDLEAAARYFAVAVYLADTDSILGMGQNYYLYLDPDTNRFSFMAWDQDHSWGNFGPGRSDELSILRPWTGSNRFLERLFAVPAFREAYLARLGEFSAALFAPARIRAQVNEVAGSIRPAVAEESVQRLARFDTAVADAEPPPPTNSRTDFNGFVGGRPGMAIKPFAVARTRSVKEQLSRLGPLSTTR